MNCIKCNKEMKFFKHNRFGFFKCSKCSDVIHNTKKSRIDKLSEFNFKIYPHIHTMGLLRPEEVDIGFIDDYIEREAYDLINYNLSILLQNKKY
tara:strand:- start:133 stop:414 length:282 start_codon:yes stop_codon:yes gene_type:complete